MDQANIKEEESAMTQSPMTLTSLKQENTIDMDNFDMDNPYFRHEMNEICGICHRVEADQQKCSLLKQITIDEMDIMAYEVLESVSQFKYSAHGPQFICSNCFLNTVSAYKFQQICNRAQQFVDKYLAHQSILEGCDTVTIDNVVVANEASNENEIQILLGPGTKVQCKVCHKFTRHDNLKKHMMIHISNHPFKCDQCDKAFIHATSLTRHKYTHAAKPSHMCKICGKAFFKPSYLKHHELRHTGVRPFKCELCNMSFKGKGELRQHATVHTADRLFPCEICPKRFKRKKALVLHLQGHSRDHRHKCNLCTRTFLQKNSLEKHLKAHNKKCDVMYGEEEVEFETDVKSEIMDDSS